MYGPGVVCFSPLLAIFVCDPGTSAAVFCHHIVKVFTVLLAPQCLQLLNEPRTKVPLLNPMGVRAK